MARGVGVMVLSGAMALAGSCGGDGSLDRGSPEIVELAVVGMHCTGCEDSIREHVGGLDGVDQVEADHTDGRVVVSFQSGGPKSVDKCGELEIAHNTILFSWSRTKDLQDMGYGARVMTKLGYDIHHNIIAGNIMAGVDHSRFDPDDWVKLDHNVIFVNKKADLEYSPASNTTLDLRVDQFEDLELASNSGNSAEIQRSLPVDPAYLEGFLAARYSEQTDLDRGSPANQWRSILGLPLQGTMSSQVTMYGNRYPYEKALELFGAVPGVGAQAPQ